MNITCLIIDDEPIARDMIEGYIRKFPALTLIKSCKNATEAYEALYEHTIDLVFLDIQMPLITGMEFLKSLRTPPLVIFTTAYSHFAVEGFELNSVDYLLKPITFERFYQAVEKAIEKFNYKRQVFPVKPNVRDYIFIKQDTKLLRVDLQDIIYIQAEKDFSSVYVGDKRILSSQHLKLFENVLPPNHFLRIHRSYIINVEKITAIKGNEVELHDLRLPVGPSYRQKLITLLDYRGKWDT